jgi:mRNA interferase MazF
MPIFRQGDVIRVPFPYMERHRHAYRPALVVSHGEIAGGLIWAAMITSSENQPWPGDYTVDDLAKAGLPIASVIRTAKLATLEAKRAQTVGHIDEGLLQEILEAVLINLGQRKTAPEVSRRGR